MTTASLLLVNLPAALASPQNDRSLAQIFGGQGAEQIKLSAATKNPKLQNEDSFYGYLLVLKALGNSPLATTWSNPFKSNETITSKTAYAETANTIWNFIVFLQSKILSYDSSSNEDIKKIKNCISDIHALIEDLQFITQNYQHKVYTPKLVETLQCYAMYLDALFLLTASQNANPKKFSNVVKSSQACYETLHKVESSLNGLDAVTKTYFTQFIPLMQKYYVGLSYFESSNEKIPTREYGVAISYLRTGLRLMTGYEKIKCPYANVSNFVKMMYLALKNKEAALDNDNATIYHMYVGESPALPQAFPIRPGLNPPTPGLLLFGEESASGFPSSEEYPSTFSTQSNITMSSVSIPTGFPGSTTTQIPNFGTQNNVPVFTPQNGTQSHVPAFTPPGYSQPYQQPPMQQTQQFQPQGFSQEDQVFPSWKMLNDLKARTIQRMHSLRASLPDTASIIDSYMQQAQVASQSDATIQGAIQRFIQAGPDPQSGLTKESIDSMIGQAVNFYNSLDDRLDQIEQRYH